MIRLLLLHDRDVATEMINGGGASLKLFHSPVFDLFMDLLIYFKKYNEINKI